MGVPPASPAICSGAVDDEAVPSNRAWGAGGEVMREKGRRQGWGGPSW